VSAWLCVFLFRNRAFYSLILLGVFYSDAGERARVPSSSTTVRTGRRQDESRKEQRWVVMNFSFHTANVLIRDGVLIRPHILFIFFFFFWVPSGRHEPPTNIFFFFLLNSNLNNFPPNFEWISKISKIEFSRGFSKHFLFPTA
jgi:hypothetical protein